MDTANLTKPTWQHLRMRSFFFFFFEREYAWGVEAYITYRLIPAVNMCSCMVEFEYWSRLKSPQLLNELASRRWETKRVRGLQTSGWERWVPAARVRLPAADLRLQPWTSRRRVSSSDASATKRRRRNRRRSVYSVEAFLLGPAQPSFPVGIAC